MLLFILSWPCTKYYKVYKPGSIITILRYSERSRFCHKLPRLMAREFGRVTEIFVKIGVCFLRFSVLLRLTLINVCTFCLTGVFICALYCIYSLPVNTTNELSFTSSVFFFVLRRYSRFCWIRLTPSYWPPFLSGNKVIIIFINALELLV